jgi:hypothetical protein
MALNHAALSSLIQAEIQAQFGPADDAGTLSKFCDAIAKAVVTHIKSDAVVTTATTVSSGSSSGSWPGIGTVS